MKRVRGDGTQARPVIERLLWLADRLRTGKPINASIFAKRWELTSKTGQRDLDFLRDRLGYDLEWDGAKHSYRLLYAPPPRL